MNVVEICSYSPHDMHFIRLNGEVVFRGNGHDFHEYCNGNEVAGYKLSWGYGRYMLARALMEAIEASGEQAEILDTELEQEQYNRLMGY